MRNTLFKRIVPVGVGIIIFDTKGNLLIGKRSVEDGFGLWATPGGFLEPSESLSECATRETLEETGLHIMRPKFYGVAYTSKKGSVYFDACMVGNVKGKVEINFGRIIDSECSEWRWVSEEEVSQYKLWEPCKAILEVYLSKKELYENHRK